VAVTIRASLWSRHQGPQGSVGLSQRAILTGRRLDGASPQQTPRRSNTAVIPAAWGSHGVQGQTAIGITELTLQNCACYDPAGCSLWGGMQLWSISEGRYDRHVVSDARSRARHRQPGCPCGAGGPAVSSVDSIPVPTCAGRSVGANRACVERSNWLALSGASRLACWSPLTRRTGHGRTGVLLTRWRTAPCQTS
jgi:hypothetical protein